MPLCLRLTPRETWEWILADSKKGQAPERGEADDLTSLAERFTGQRTLVFIPASQCVVSEAQLPNKSRTAYDTIPFQIEEVISEAVEGLHLTCGPYEEGRVQVLGFPRERLAAMIAEFNELGLELTGVFPDFVLLQDDEPTLWREEGYALVHHPACQASITEPLLSQWLPQQEWYVELRELVGESTLLASCYEPGKIYPYNMLNGEFANNAWFGNLLQQIKIPALAACFAGVIGLSALGMENYQLQQQVDQLDQAMEDLYRRTFPREKKVRRPYNQMKAKARQLSRGGDTESLLTLLNSSAPSIKRNGMDINNMQINAARGNVQILLAATDFGQFERLQAQLKDLSLNYKMGSIVQNQGKVTGLLTLSQQQARQ